MAKKNTYGEGVNGPVPLLALGIGIISLFLGLFFTAQAALLLLLGAWLAAASWRYPKQAFLGLIFFAPLLPILKATQVLSAVTPLKDFVILVLFVRVVALPIFWKKDKYRRNDIILPVIFLLAVTFIALIRSDNYIVGILRLRDIVLYMPLLWIARYIVSSHRDFSLFLKTLFTSLAAVLLLALTQFILFADGMVLRFDPSNNVWIPRASSTLAHPNILGSFLLCVLPFAVVYAWNNFSFSWRYKLLGLLALAGSLGVYFTYSRGSWLSYAAALVSIAFIYALKNRRFSSAKVAAVVVVVALILLAVPRTRTLLRTVIDPNYASNWERIKILSDLVIETNNTEALVGGGLGDIMESTNRVANISLADIAATNVQSIQQAKAQTFVDNAVIKTWIEAGLAGILVVAWLLYIALRMTLELARKGRLANTRSFGTGLFAVTVGLVVLSFSLDVPEIFPVMLLWWTFLGVLEALPYLSEVGTPELAE